MMTDPIADMLTRIRNAQQAHMPLVVLPHSKLKMNIAQILEREGYVGRVEKTDDKFAQIRIRLKYAERAPAITSIQRVSKPGHRAYVKADELKVVQSGFGISILSTSKGLMTNKEAHKQKLGGEMICEVY
ncbi:MAG: ribosomal protein S8 [Candidatus Magasanikbacteria bacterium]|nr:ribosomal protein S8 [Candidatus Magasanikbacteria bacterium]